MAKDRVPVNLADPKDIRAKMPDIKKLLANAKQELDALKEQVEMLTRIVGEEPAAPVSVEVSGGGSATVSGRKTPKPKGSPKAAPAQDRAIRALERAGRPMGPASLFRFMEAEGIEMPATLNRLNATLWAAAKAGRVVKAPNGVYAPLGTPTDRPLTNYDAARANGMPVPGRLPGTNGSAPPKAAQQASPNGVHPPGEGQEQGGEVGSRYGTG